MTNVLMIDDDQKQIQQITNLMDSSEQDYHLFSTNTAHVAMEIIEQHPIDIIVLNIEINNQSGIEFAKEIRKIPGCEFVWIIFLSCNEIESEAYQEIHCYNYYIKPYETKALFGTIEELSRYKITKVRKEEREFVTIKQKDLYIRVLTKDILYIEVIGNNSTIYTYNNIYLLRKMSLRRLKLLLPDNFIQCHKSYIVNRNYIEAIQKGLYGWEIILKNYGTPVPNGGKFKSNLTELVKIS